MAGQGASVRGLVTRLGGAERLREILVHFYDKVSIDSIVGFFFAPFDLARIVDGQHTFLMRAFGETQHFGGRHPGVAHQNLAPIGRGQFDRRLVLLREVLAEEGVAEGDIEAWVRVEEGMRKPVERGPPSPRALEVWRVSNRENNRSTPAPPSYCLCRWFDELWAGDR